jgi:glycosyltransferase involved in cell wall biosynthesis
MNIIWLTKLTDSDQFRRTQMEMSKALRKRGHSVSLILARHFTEKKQTQENTIYLPTINHRILSGLIYGLVILCYLPWLLKNKKADVVIVSGDTVWSPFLLTSRLRHTLIFDLRSLSVDKDQSLAADISLFFSKYLFNGLTTITPELGQVLEKRYRIPKEKIGIWTSGISDDFFNNSLGKIALNEIDFHRLILIHHGTYSPTRGVENLICSIAQLDESMKNNILLLLVGIPQNVKPGLEKMCKELKIQKEIKIILPVDKEKIPLYINSADIGIIPLSTSNQWWWVSSPLKTLEYLALKKPIIATSIPFHQKIFDKGKCGIIIRDNKPKTIANAIISLYSNKDQLDNMGKIGQEIVKKNYTWEISAINLENFINIFI